MNFKFCKFSFIFFCFALANQAFCDSGDRNFLKENYWANTDFIQLDTLPPLVDRNGDFVTDPNSNPFDLKDPKIIEKNVEYDAESGLYIITEKIDASNFRSPMYLSPEEYFKWRAAQEDKGLS